MFPTIWCNIEFQYKTKSLKCVDGPTVESDDKDVQEVLIETSNI